MNCLKQIITNIQKDMEEPNSTVKMIETKYNTFAQQYPTLFRLLINKQLDMTKLDKMLQTQMQIQQGSLTYDEASRKMGRRTHHPPPPANRSA